MYSLIIKKATIIDGSGKKGFVGDVAIEDDKIVAVAPNITASGKKIFDATDLVLSPGFIDVQNHSDSYWQLFDNPTLDSLVTQGFTTILVGNSGASLAPLISEHSILSVQKWKSIRGMNVDWRTFSEYKAQLSSKKYGTNVASLVGYSTIRRGLLGDSTEPPSKSEMDSMLKIIDGCLRAGAKGISVGLQYSHELNVTHAELFSLAELCVKHDKMLAVALRRESKTIVSSMEELCAIAEQTGVKLRISHLKIRYEENKNLLTQVLDNLESSWHRGAKIYFDSYPYNFTWQPLYTYLPTWSLEGGRAHLLEQLSSFEKQEKILSYLRNHAANLSELIVTSTSQGLKVNGKTIASIAKDMNLTSEQTILNIIKTGGSGTMVFDHCLDPKVVSIINNHSLGLISTNGGGFNLEHSDSLTHPRSFGTSTKFLHNVIANKEISLNEAIAKLTSRPAELIGLPKRGMIKTGYFADLVLFNPQEVDSQASINNPYQYSSGIKAVWVNGQLAVSNSNPLGVLAGEFL